MRVSQLFAFALLSTILIASAGCRRRPAAQTGTMAQGGPAAAGTTLTPDPPPLCGDLGRPYLAPSSRGQTDPAEPSPGLGTVNARDSRIIREGESFKEYSRDDQDLIRQGRARVGLDEKAAYLANGLPAFYWNTQIDDRRCRVLLYGIVDDEGVDTAMYSCDGVLTHIGPVQPGLPCWRLEEVAPRAIERAPHFDEVGVERQWEILHGLLKRGQTVDDVWIAFGEPYRTGLEAREDGTNANQYVYLDNAGDAYGLYLTFVDRQLRGWRFPPDRQLTPEAEQRRLDAMEQRVMDQMREMEQASMQRHQEEMQHMNQIQQNQDQIRTDIESARSAILTGQVAQGAATRDLIREGDGGGGNGGGGASSPPNPGRRPSGGGGGGGGRRPPPSGCQTFTFNGTRYSDNHGTPMGTACGTDANPGCPNGYTCLMPLGRCMPHPNRQRCTN